MKIVPNLLWGLLLWGGLSLSGFSESTQQKKAETVILLENTPQGSLNQLKVKYHNLVGQGKVRFIHPQKLRRVLFIFPGYTPAGDPYQQRAQWLEKYLDLRKYADRWDCLIVIPEMQTSVYEMAYTPGTISKWDPKGNIPGGVWVSQVLPNLVAEIYSLPAGTPFYALGISTGAQGAIKFGLEQQKQPNPYPLKGVMVLSGTFEPSFEASIHLPVLGSAQTYAEAWQRENLSLKIPQIHFPLWVFCETNSSFNKHNQEFLARAKAQNNRIVGNTRLIPGSQHNWAFWSHPKIFQLLDKLLNDQPYSI